MRKPMPSGLNYEEKGAQLGEELDAYIYDMSQTLNNCRDFCEKRGASSELFALLELCDDVVSAWDEVKGLIFKEEEVTYE